jgi:endonuclease YncB( thermonuclease family)
VRILGINTPEKKNPFRPQECFGEEASKRAKEIL